MGSEEDRLVDSSSHRVSPVEARRLRIATLVVAWITVIGLGALATTTLVFGLKDGSSSGLFFALQAFLDCMSSLVVIWRFS